MVSSAAVPLHLPPQGIRPTGDIPKRKLQTPNSQLYTPNSQPPAQYIAARSRAIGFDPAAVGKLEWVS